MLPKNKIQSIPSGHQHAPGFDLLQPEILAVDDLVMILQRMKIKRASIDTKSLDKSELLELYYDLVLPLPQRKYRENRRGRLLTQKQKSIDDSCGRRDHSEENHMLGNARKLKDGTLCITDVLTPVNQSKTQTSLRKREAHSTPLEDIVIQNKPRKNDAFCLPKKKKKVTLAELTEPRTPLENVIVKTRKNTDTCESDTSPVVASCKLAARMLSLKSPPQKRRCTEDPFDSIVINKFEKKSSIDLDKHKPSRIDSPTSGDKTQNLLLPGTDDSALVQSPTSSSNTEDSGGGSPKKKKTKTVPVTSGRPSDSSPSAVASTLNKQKKRVKLKRPPT